MVQVLILILIGLILLGQKMNREISLNLKHGVEAKNYDDLAKAEKLKPMEVELRRLEDLSESIVQDFAYMRQREEEMRSTNGIYNFRLHLMFFRVDECSCALLKHILYVMSFMFGDLAGVIPSTLFQGQKTH